MRSFVLYFMVATLLIACAGPEKKTAFETVFYPPLPQMPKLQFLTHISSEDDLGKRQSSFKDFLVGEQMSTKIIGRPYDVGAAKGKIYVSDRDKRAIIILDLVNKEFNFLDTSGAGQITDPAGIWVTKNDFKYISDIKRKQILVFDDKNKFVKAYGKRNQFSKPLDVAVYEDKIYVCDFIMHQIIVVDLVSGDTVQTISEMGFNEGQLFKPTHITISEYGDIYVTDAFNFRIQAFNLDGEYVMTFGYHGDTLGGFARPKGIGVDREGDLYVVDTAFENVQIFENQTGNLLLFFGGYGTQPGQMFMPSAIWIDYENVDYFKKYADKNFRIEYIIYVGNMYGREKINVYGFGEWIGEALPDMTE